MQSLNLNIRDLYNLVYGVRNSTWNSTVVRDFEGVKDTLEGVVLAMPTKLQISPRGDAEEMWQLPNEPLISVQGKKSIVMSSIDGQDGTFKELYSVDDWRVVIQGICINDDNLSEEYPQEQIRKIKRIINVKSSRPLHPGPHTCYNGSDRGQPLGDQERIL